MVLVVCGEGCFCWWAVRVGTSSGGETLGGSCHGASEQGALRSPGESGRYWTCPVLCPMGPLFFEARPMVAA